MFECGAGVRVCGERIFLNFVFYYFKCLNNASVFM